MRYTLLLSHQLVKSKIIFPWLPLVSELANSSLIFSFVGWTTDCILVEKVVVIFYYICGFNLLSIVSYEIVFSHFDSQKPLTYFYLKTRSIGSIFAILLFESLPYPMSWPSSYKYFNINPELSSPKAS